MSAPVYLEYDGRVFLVEEDGLLRLPTPDEVPFDHEEIAELPLPSGTAIEARPFPPRRPTDWPWKDDLPGRDDVDPLVQEAIHRTMSRMVAKIAYLDEGRILLVKTKVGVYAGHWQLPGGYVDHGEHPRDSVVRETREEVGVEGRPTELLDVASAMLRGKGLHFVMFLFLGELLGDGFSPEPDEIEAVRWFEIDKAVETMPASMSRGLLEDHLDELG